MSHVVAPAGVLHQDQISGYHDVFRRARNPRETQPRGPLPFVHHSMSRQIHILSVLDYRNVVVLSDGAPWIRGIVDDVLPGAMVTLDWYHVAEHASATAAVLYSEGPGRKRWRTRLLNMLWKGDVNGALAWLAHQSMRFGAGTEAQLSVADLHQYLNKRRDALHYAEAREQGLYIGSGVVESAMDHVAQQRMKRSGMRWRSDGAASMLALRCAYRSTGGFETLFDAKDEPSRAA